MGRQPREGLRAQITHALVARQRVPSVVPRRLLSYCRYADDYVVVLCPHTTAEAQHLKAAMAQGLEAHLGLTQHPEKTCLTHGDDRVRFLGYDRRGRRNPNGTRWLRLSIPPEKARDVKAKTTRLWGYTQIPALDLCMRINALMRGWTNYCRYANNATNRCLSLTGVVYWLTAHYLGRKHRCSITRLMRTRYGVDPAGGKRALYTTGIEGKRVSLWNKPPPRRSLFSGVVEAKDAQPLSSTSGAKGHSYAQRVQVGSRSEQRCEHGGPRTPNLIVHHPHGLGKFRQRKLGPANVVASGQEQQVKLLCFDGHQQQHPNGWNS